MFNKRSFLVGLGSGVIIGALLLQLVYASESSQAKLNQLSEQLESAEGQSGTNQQEQPGKLEETENKQVQVDIQENADLPINPESSEQMLDQDAATDTELDEQNTGTGQITVDPEGAPSKGRLLRIEPGSSLTRAAQLLEDNGVIEDASIMIREMKSAKKEVRAGTFLFQTGLSAEQAIKIVTDTPLTADEIKKYKAELENEIN